MYREQTGLVSVEVDQQNLRQVELPELVQEVHHSRFWEIVDPKKPEGFHSRHSVVEYGDGGAPEVNCHLHSFECI